MKFENTLRNKLLFLWVFLSLLISILTGINNFEELLNSRLYKDYNIAIGSFIGVLIVTSPPIILQLIYNNHFKNKKVKKTLRNLLLLFWVILTVISFFGFGMNYIDLLFDYNSRVDNTILEDFSFGIKLGLFLTSIQLIFNYLFRE